MHSDVLHSASHKHEVWGCGVPRTLNSHWVQCELRALRDWGAGALGEALQRWELTNIHAWDEVNFCLLVRTSLITGLVQPADNHSSINDFLVLECSFWELIKLTQRRLQFYNTL